VGLEIVDLEVVGLEIVDLEEEEEEEVEAMETNVACDLKFNFSQSKIFYFHNKS